MKYIKTIVIGVLIVLGASTAYATISPIFVAKDNVIANIQLSTGGTVSVQKFTDLETKVTCYYSQKDSGQMFVNCVK